MEGFFDLPVPRVKPDIVVGDEDYDLHEWGFPGKVVYAPGHTDSHIALVMDDRTAFTGDTFLDWRTVDPLVDLYPERTVGLNWIVAEPDKIKDSVRRLLDLADTFYGGHGEPCTREEVEPLID